MFYGVKQIPTSDGKEKSHFFFSNSIFIPTAAEKSEMCGLPRRLSCRSWCTRPSACVMFSFPPAKSRPGYCAGVCFSWGLPHFKSYFKGPPCERTLYCTVANEAFLRLSALGLLLMPINGFFFFPALGALPYGKERGSEGKIFQDLACSLWEFVVLRILGVQCILPSLVATYPAK